MRWVLTFPIALAGLSGLTVLGVAASLLSGHREFVPFVFVAVAVLAVWFLWVYSRRPGPRFVAEEPEDAEPFEDPVEIADRLEADEPPEGPGVGPSPLPPSVLPSPVPVPGIDPPVGPEPPMGPSG